jgi:hypothetical protein
MSTPQPQPIRCVRNAPAGHQSAARAIGREVPYRLQGAVEKLPSCRASGHSLRLPQRPGYGCYGQDVPKWLLPVVFSCCFQTL